MVAGWQPATGLERTLFEAIQRGDHEEYLRLLRGATLLVPVQQDASGQTTGWVTSASGGRTYLLGYTSTESLAGVAGDRRVPYLTTSLQDLARRWPDRGWWLAVNSGLPIEALVAPDYLAGLVTAAPEPPAEPAPAPEADAAPAPADEIVVDPDRFEPANETEAALLDAVRQGHTDAYLKALIVAELLVPATGADPATWPRIQVSGEPAIPLFTSRARLAERYGDTSYHRVDAVTVVRDWPGRDVALALNPGTPVGGHLPGLQVAELAEWAAEIGLLDILAEDTVDDTEDTAGPAVERDGAGAPAYAVPQERPEPVGWLQKLLPHQHVGFYQQRGYHLVSGFVHPLREVGTRVRPARLYQLLGLDGPDSPFAPEDPHVHAVRWPAYRDGRYGDPDRSAGSGVVPQLRVAGVPLPHGALLVRIDRAGEETVVASFDADGAQWRTGTGEAP